MILSLPTTIAMPCDAKRLMGQRRKIFGYEHVDRRSLLDLTGPEEEYANEFAAALLMPEQPFRQEWKRLGESGVRLILLGVKFGVPPEHVRYRAGMLGLR